MTKQTVLIIGVGLACAQTLVAQSFRVDAQTNCIDAPLSTKGVNVSLPSAGTYTFTLKASDFRDNAGEPTPQRHVLVAGNSLLGDYRVFSLNGLGSSKSLSWPGGDLKLFFVDESVLFDNAGSSVVTVSNNMQLVGEFAVDSQANCIDAELAKTAVNVHLPQAGTYSFTLTASDFRDNAGEPSPQRHVLVAGNAWLGDNRNFALNGVGDSKLVFWPGGDLKLFFLDESVLSDNTGSSTVEVKRVLPALSIQTAAVAISWLTATNENYQVQYASVLAPNDWTNLGSPIQGTGTNAVVVDSILGQPMRFYRLIPAP
jgi:hypothetical protein